MLRSPYSHARIRSIDTSEAAAMPGVIKVYTGTNCRGGPWPDALSRRETSPAHAADGSPMYEPKRLALSENTRSLLSATTVAFVVAETRAHERRRRLIEVDYEELDPVVEIQDALAATPNAIWDDCPDNICFRMDVGDKAATDTAFANAHHVSHVEIPFARVAINPMERAPPSASTTASKIATHLHSGNQFPRFARLDGPIRSEYPGEQTADYQPGHGRFLPTSFQLLPGANAGSWAAKQLERPVKWINELTAFSKSMPAIFIWRSNLPSMRTARSSGF